MSAQLDSAIRYRRIGEVDLERVLAIESVVHSHPWTRGNFADSIVAGYECWMAECDGRCIGYLVLIVAADEAHLLNLSVAREWQRQGIGAQLTTWVLKLAREQRAQTIYLEVRPSNTAARALYGRCGFVEVGMRRDYYPALNGRENAIVMELRF
ncbi:MAG: ribosomal protein S18-alanine N-acetyltransferase [Pseudomonadota bacterium]